MHIGSPALCLFMKSRFLLLKARTVLWGGLSVALPAQAFDLAEAFAAAENHSAEYAAAKHAHDAEVEQKIQARAPLLPQAHATAAYQRQPASLSGNTIAHGWGVQVSQAIVDAPALMHARQGRLAAEMAALRLQETGNRLRLQVAEAYFKVLLHQEQLAAAQEEKTAHEAQIHQAQALFAKGVATVIETHEARAGYDAAVAKEVAAYSQLQLARNGLHDLTGLNPAAIRAIGTEWRIIDLLGRRKESQWQQAAQLHNHEWQLQRLALADSHTAVQAARSAYAPKVSVHAGYQDYHNTQEAWGRAQPYRSKGATFSVQLNLPLYQGGHNASKLREAQARALQQQALLSAAERRVRLAVRQAYRDTHDHHYRVLAQKRLLHSSQTRLESIRVGRHVGMRSQLDELQAVQARAAAQAQLAEARYGHVMAYLRLLGSTGELNQPTFLQALQQRLYGP